MPFLVPPSQFAQLRSFVLLPALLTYFPAAQFNHAAHESWFDVVEYVPVAVGASLDESRGEKEETEKRRSDSSGRSTKGLHQYTYRYRKKDIACC